MDSQDSNSQIRTWQSSQEDEDWPSSEPWQLSEPWQSSESPSQDILTTGMKESVYPPTVSHVHSQGAIKPEFPRLFSPVQTTGAMKPEFPRLFSPVQTTGAMKSQSQSQSQSQGAISGLTGDENKADSIKHVMTYLHDNPVVQATINNMFDDDDDDFVPSDHDDDATMATIFDDEKLSHGIRAIHNDLGDTDIPDNAADDGKSIKTFMKSILEIDQYASQATDFSISLLTMFHDYDLELITSSDTPSTNAGLRKQLMQMGVHPENCTGDILRKVATAYTETNQKGNRCDKDSQGEFHQMASLWHPTRTEKSKLGKCYLCALPIVKPEMEHKKPATTLFTQNPHYFTLKRYAFDIPDDDTTDSVWWLWQGFLADNQESIETLYNIMNETPDFNETDVDDQIEIIFGMFKQYISNLYPDIQLNDAENTKTFEYSKALLTFWLTTFAYACSECNGLKSGLDLNIEGSIEKKEGRAYAISTIRKKTKPGKHLNAMKTRLAEGGPISRHMHFLQSKQDNMIKLYPQVSVVFSDTIDSVIEEHQKKYIDKVYILQFMKSLWRMIR